MVNLVAAHRALLKRLMKMAMVRPYTVDIEPGTVVNFWVPSQTITKPKNRNETPKLIAKPTRPVVVLVHGFTADGILTWQFQVGALAKNYAVYVPDLVFFGGSFTDKPDRSPAFQAECLATGLMKLGVERCVVVGFSYGGIVAFKMAELYPELVQAMVISGSVLVMTEPVTVSLLNRLGYSSLWEFLLPTSVKELKALFAIAVYKNLWWFSKCVQKDYLEVTFPHRKERRELLEALVISNEDLTNTPSFPQRIHFLWGEDDRIFKLELAQDLKEQLGANATLQAIQKAGHLVQLERPCVFNKSLKQFLSSLQPATKPKK